MENEKTDIRRLATLYFEGRISREDEKSLFDFIRKEESNKAQFKCWEREWMQSEHEDAEVLGEWNRLQGKIRTQEAIAPLLTVCRCSVWKKVAAVAAIALLIIGSGYGAWQAKSYLEPETYFAFETPYGEKSKMTLSDGTVVWLNAGSTLKYSNRFRTVHREVILDGEAYFEVTKQQGSPFIVKTGSCDVHVKGTKFNVTAYSEDSFAAVTLLEGAVDLGYKGQQIRMTPGESVRLNLPSDTFIRSRVNAVQAGAWTENRIEYEAITLKELVERLSRQYNVNIVLESTTNKHKEFRISIRNQETIGEVLEAISEIIPIHIEYNENKIYIRE